MGSMVAGRAGENAAGKRLSERYLIIIDTSASMRRNSDNLRTVMGSLLKAGMDGQLEDGDTIGVWTFSESLQTGEFPLQTWSAQTSPTIVSNIDTFLRGLHFEKKSLPENMIPQMKAVAAGSERITMMVLTGGDAPFIGTPLDQQINYAFQNSHAELQKLRTPFVIVFRSQRGKFVGGSVTWSPWPVDFPEFPPLPQPKEQVVSKEVVANAAPPVKSLIVIGKKPEPVVTAQASVASNDLQTTAIVEAKKLPLDESPSREGSNAAVANPEGQLHGVSKVTVEPQPEPPAEHVSNTGNVPASGETLTSPSQVAVATPEGAISSSRLYLVAGLVALVLGIGLAGLMLRRQRAISGGSLITRSMDHEDE